MHDDASVYVGNITVIQRLLSRESSHGRPIRNVPRFLGTILAPLPRGACPGNLPETPCWLNQDIGSFLTIAVPVLEPAKLLVFGRYT